MIEFLKYLFCRHDYNLVNQFTMKSQFEIVDAAGRTPNSYNSIKQLVVTDYKCSHCKRIKRLTVTTPSH